ncbi:MAG: BolA/IbaG family iron-sulfur metabolism protein [gamma proteobacterium symbiont of Ctena orbiculata]|nr:BolA/IbaG family iron-sulfur metabolism protein [Candidatus Thiodiazotropha taylori]MBT3058930.1 BolA/IbaG family iron-sulfur metabolism protein [Candidatus Thiodiazotropha sp. (ex Lucina pensylvanica)]MBV2096907.1 BolA/IbaG family iron-sulfur metabolism protein [Candidatus Thiodiazotropha sp. (ex Codakia orbicularis)]PUB72607.1 MAG: BolA family protein [gamma proteobacterium symbiont of Ctena orbiculata]MBT3065149.1 BolA/IbaG family iron-sulfur metabolism protein [Candidatus Thiodiazotropha
MNEQDLINRIQGLYPDAEISVAGESCSFEVNVTTSAFDNMKSLQRQRSILTLFKEEIASGELHALTVRAKTPEEIKP